jgi:hypothetical protein
MHQQQHSIILHNNPPPFHIHSSPPHPSSRHFLHSDISRESQLSRAKKKNQPFIINDQEEFRHRY